jgi:hypothetical protein
LLALWLLLDGASTSLSAQIAFQAASLATGPHPVAVAVGDFNGDGKPDLAVAMQGNNDVYIYTGNGDGTFQYGGFRSVGAAPKSSEAVWRADCAL